MTAVTPSVPAPAHRMPLAAGIAALVVWMIVAIAAPRAALHGWLIAFASVGGIPLGAFGWLAIYRLTGGRWGELAGPMLARAACMLPWVVLFWLPLEFARRLVYPWSADPGSVDEGVGALYLNGTSVGVRSLLFLVGLCLLARQINKGGLGRLGAGLALVFFAVLMNFIAFDWLLSLDPRFTSSAFGAQLIVGQLMSALAFVVVLDTRPERDPAWKDIGALLLATTLGETYLILMTFVVFWYGDQPEKADWYLRRSHDGWLWLELAGVLIGSLGPLVALLFSKVRDHAEPLRIVGVCLLVGTFAQAVWLVSPVTEVWSVITGAVAATAMVGLCWGLLGPTARVMGASAHAG